MWEPKRQHTILFVRLRHERRTACILISHDLHAVSDQADRVLSINKEMIACGLPAEVFSRKNLSRLYGRAVRHPEH
jgi:ABC-type Mn2+/Zn2+ transport system ATPase subunit